ncbi:MAG: alpha/beta hydrolase [Candidatus Paceibacterota bacterium]
MAKIIYVGGLGHHPETTFKPIKDRLEQEGHEVIILDTSHINTHEDRVQLVLKEYDKYYIGAHIGVDVFLLGQSAGGSAVRIAAERLEKEGKPLAGVILLSPAMPFGIFFMTLPLWNIMKKRWAEILFGKVINPTEEEFETLLAPLAKEGRAETLASRRSISGIESRTLAFNSPRFVGYKFPTLHIFGDCDKWIAPSAQRKLSKKLRIRSDVCTREVEGTGHITFTSRKGDRVVSLIVGWIKVRSVKILLS